MDILKIENLQKSFDKNKVIDGLSLIVPEHSIFGFLGQNGAGKTTTMKMVLGLLKADGGTIQVCGEDVKFGQTNTNNYIGYLPDVPEFYSYMRPKEYLHLCGEITGMTDQRIKERTESLLELVGLSGVNKKIGGFSRGMKQRLGIAQALINEPKLLICDEPTSALDPVGRKEILDILLSIKGKTTVVFSTHILSDVEKICDHIAILNQGKIVKSGTIKELREQHKPNKIFITFTDNMEQQKFIKNAPDYNVSEFNDFTVSVHTENFNSDYMNVSKILINENIVPRKIEIAEPTIESLFLEVVS